MKKVIYIVTITVITCICIVIGLLYHVLGFSFDDGMFHSEKTASEKLTNSVETDTFTKIDLDISMGELEIIEGDVYAVSYHGKEKLAPEVSVENGVLRIYQKRKIAVLFNNGTENKVTITIPSDAKLQNVGLLVDAGNICIDGFTIQNLQTELNAGNLEMDNCIIEHAEIDVDAGNVDVGNSTITQGDLSTDAGNISGKTLTFDRLEVSSDMGNIDMDLPLSYDEYSFDLEVDLGNITINGEDYRSGFAKDGIKGHNRLEAECNMGNIDIHVK